MCAYMLTPDDEANAGGKVKTRGLGARNNGYPPEPKAPAPAPLRIDQQAAIYAPTESAMNYPGLLSDSHPSTDGLTNKAVEQYFNEQMTRWSKVPEYEDLIKPYQLWLGLMARSGVHKVNPIYGYIVPATGQYGVGAKQSVSLTNKNLSVGTTNTCLGFEGGVSPAPKDGLSGSMDTTYSINFGYFGFSLVPDKSFSIRIEFCVIPQPLGFSVGVRGTRGFNETLNRPKPRPSPTPLIIKGLD